MIFDLKKVVENRQRNINRMFTPIIKVIFFHLQSNLY